MRDTARHEQVEGRGEVDSAGRVGGMASLRRRGRRGRAECQRVRPGEGRGLPDGSFRVIAERLPDPGNASAVPDGRRGSTGAGSPPNASPPTGYATLRGAHLAFVVAGQTSVAGQPGERAGLAGAQGCRAQPRFHGSHQETQLHWAASSYRCGSGGRTGQRTRPTATREPPSIRHHVRIIEGRSPTPRPAAWQWFTD